MNPAFPPPIVAPKRRREGRQILIAFGIAIGVLVPAFVAGGACGWMSADETPGWLQPVCNLVDSD